MDARGRPVPRSVFMSDNAMVPDPESLRTEQELLAAVNRLRISVARRRGKARLSLRDLEAATGVPKSSLANYLTGRTIMPVDVLDRVVLALGIPPNEAGRWSAAWERVIERRLASDEPDPETPGSGRTDAQVDTASPAAGGGPAREQDRWRLLARVVGRRRALPLAVGALLVAAVSWVGLSGGGSEDLQADGPSSQAGTPTRGFAFASGGSVVRIRPARTPHLCLTDGHEHTGRYRPAIAVQRPCEQAHPPHTLIEPVGGGLYRIKWDHPEEGLACLTVLDSGPAKDMLEPWNDCVSGKRSQLFRIEPVDAPVPGTYRLRPAHTDFCLGIRDDETASDAEIIQQPCANERDQVFLIDLMPPT